MIETLPSPAMDAALRDLVNLILWLPAFAFALFAVCWLALRVAKRQEAKNAGKPHCFEIYWGEGKEQSDDRP